MLDVLIESAPSHVLKPARLLASLLTHAFAIGLMVGASRTGGGGPPVAVADTTLFFFARLAPPAVAPETRPPPSQPVPTLVVTDPPPKGFQTVVAPEDIPTTIPPIDLAERPFDPRDYTGRGVEGGVADGVIGGTGKVDPRTRPAGDVIYTAATEDARFQPAMLISQPEPKYPPVLQEIGLSGRVSLQFLVDTTGRVDRASIEVIESTHEGFVSPARESVARAIFRPARMGGDPVRQLAVQAIRFVVPE